MCTYTVVTHPCHIPPLAQARPMMLCIYTSGSSGNSGNSGSWGEPERAPHQRDFIANVCVSMLACLLAWIDHLPKILNKWV